MRVFGAHHVGFDSKTMGSPARMPVASGRLSMCKLLKIIGFVCFGDGGHQDTVWGLGRPAEAVKFEIFGPVATPWVPLD